jgi:hypothetical protein
LRHGQREWFDYFTDQRFQSVGLHHYDSVHDERSNQWRLLLCRQTICTNGIYDWPSNWASLLAQCKAVPSSVNRIEMCLGGAGDTSWRNIKNLIAANGINATTVLYQNLSALKTALGIDAIDSDDESAFDSASAIQFGKMCSSVGLKMTLCPYNNPSYWSAVQSGLGTNCDAISSELRCNLCEGQARAIVNAGNRFCDDRKDKQAFME